MKEKIYCGSGKRKTFDWGSIVEETLDLDVLIAEFNNHGYVSKQGKKVIKITLSQRKEEGTYGETHYSTINTWHVTGYIPPPAIQIVATDEGIEKKSDYTPNEDKDFPF